MFDHKLRWLVAAGVSAAVAAAAVALMPMGRTGSLPSALAADAEFVPDVMLREFIDPGHLAAVPVGPGRVAQPVAQVLTGSQIVKTLGDNGIPEVAERAYRQAAAQTASCGLHWSLLAAIGRVESNHGQFGGTQLRADGTGTMKIRGLPLDGRANVARIRDTDGGALDGDPVYDRAVGPMQFIPSTWRLVQADGNGDGRADVFNIFDAALGAARYLCDGATNLGDPAQAAAAVRRYNNADEYVRVVLRLAAMYESGRVDALPPAALPQLPRASQQPPSYPWPPSYRQPTQPWDTHTPTAKPTKRRPATHPPTTRPTTRPTVPEPTKRPTPGATPTRPAKPITPAPQPAQSSRPTQQPTTRPSSPPTLTPTPSAAATTPTKPTTEPSITTPTTEPTTAPTTTPTITPTGKPSTEPSTWPSTPMPSAKPPKTVDVGWAPAMRVEVVRTLKAVHKPRPSDRPSTAPRHPNKHDATEPRSPSAGSTKSPSANPTRAPSAKSTKVPTAKPKAPPSESTNETPSVPAGQATPSPRPAKERSSATAGPATPSPTGSRRP